MAKGLLCNSMLPVVSSLYWYVCKCQINGKEMVRAKPENLCTPSTNFPVLLRPSTVFVFEIRNSCIIWNSHLYWIWYFVGLIIFDFVVVSHFCAQESNNVDCRKDSKPDQKCLTETVGELFKGKREFQYPHEVILKRKVSHESNLKQEPNDDFDNAEYLLMEAQCDGQEDADQESLLSDIQNNDDEFCVTAEFLLQYESSSSKTLKDKSVRQKIGSLKTKDDRYACEKCGKCFPSQARLKSHIVIHSDFKPFQCSFCSKRFLRSCTLSAHEITHIGKKPFPCIVCNKTFADRSTLAVHHRTHTGERPYGCDECGKRFNNPGHLKRHRRIHSGERPYRCPECSRCFGQQMSLKVHLRTHSGSKPFACDLCGKQFVHSSHVNRHKRRAHIRNS